MSLESFLKKLELSPNSIEFEDTMSIIDAGYQYIPTVFKNGDVNNLAGENEGSCKLFYFAKLNKLSQQQTLSCFGKYYREDVLRNPTGSDHQNIRNFMRTAWEGIEFQGQALIAK